MSKAQGWSAVEVSSTTPPEFLRHVCTQIDPWDKTKGGRATHSDAYEVGHQRDGYPGGDLQDYECPHCKHRWTQELPQ